LKFSAIAYPPHTAIKIFELAVNKTPLLYIEVQHHYIRAISKIIGRCRGKIKRDVKGQGE
jgi:hypothetical protein